MNKILFALLLIAFAAYGQQKQIAIMNTEDDGEPPVGHLELSHLTDRLREIAGKMLPERNYGVMTQQSIVAYLGSQESMAKKCKESKGCLAQLGREINTDYICQGRIGRFGKDFTIKAELYEVQKGNLVGSFTGSSKDIYGLLAVLDKEAPGMFRKMPGVSGIKTPAVAGGISNLQSGTDDEFNVERRYLANFATEPAGAVLSFNGVPTTSCAKTPCSTELAEGSIRIIAVLDQYETADTTVSIKQNKQNINIKLKPNFGFLEIKPAYSEGIGKSENWSLAINGKAVSSWENRLPLGKHSVKLTHRCYEDISFDVGINRDKREVFDIASRANLKKGGLVLSAEKDGKPVSEPVFVDGKRAGETPFSGSVAVCSEIGIGFGKGKVNVKLEYKQTVRYVHKISGGVKGGVLTDSRDGKKYKTVKIGAQTWMAENLNYEAGTSVCYENNPANCQKYGRLYDWSTAKQACPSGWHLPSKNEYETLDMAVGGEGVAAEKLKATSGWNSYQGKSGNGTDEFGFSALPGGFGSFGGPTGIFRLADTSGTWWSTSEDERYSSLAYNWVMNYSTYWYNSPKYIGHSVRCLRDDIKLLLNKNKNKNKNNIANLHSDWVLKNIAGLQSTGKTELGGRRDSATGGFNDGYAEGGSGGIGDMLGGLRGGSAGGIGTTARRGSLIAPSAHDIGDGSRSKQEIMQVVNARMPGLRDVYNKHLKLKPGFSGKIILKFTIAPGGDIISISIVSSTTGYAEFDNAVKNMVGTWKWKAIKSGNTTPTIPFNFTE